MSSLKIEHQLDVLVCDHIIQHLVVFLVPFSWSKNCSKVTPRKSIVSDEHWMAF
jgi:hypothetical protein